MPELDLIQRAQGAFLGFAIGDALGATTEFMTPREIACEHGTHRNITGGGWLRLKPGQVTDDTEMSIFLARTLIAHQGLSALVAATAFGDWMRTRPVDIGQCVRQGIRKFLRRGITQMPFTPQGGGNGACMRNLPVILVCLKNWSKFNTMTQLQAHCTHNHPVSDQLTLVFGELTRCLLEGQGKLAALDIASHVIRETPKWSFSRYRGESSAYIVDSFKCVMHHFFDGTSFEDILIRTVNQGGDADTNGALAGMLAGALHGPDAIPRRWKRKLDPNVRREIQHLTPLLLDTPARRLPEDRHPVRFATKD